MVLEKLEKLGKYIYKYKDKQTGVDLYRFEYPRLYCKYKYDNKLKVKNGLTKEQAYQLKERVLNDAGFLKWKRNRQPTRFLKKYKDNVYYNTRVLDGHYDEADDLVVTCQCLECGHVSEVMYNSSFLNRDKLGRLGSHKKGCSYDVKRKYHPKQGANASNKSTGHRNISYHNINGLFIFKIARNGEKFITRTKSLEEALRIKVFVLSYYEQHGVFPKQEEVL